MYNDVRIEILFNSISGNGFSPGWHQAFALTNGDIMSIGSKE